LVGGIPNSQTTPQNIDVGVFVEDIYGIDFQNSQYQIIFWLWINSDDEHFDFLQDLDLSNCAEIEITSIQYSENNNRFHSECKIRALILNKFNVVDYPFDNQLLSLRLDLTKYTESSNFRFSFDDKSILKPEFIQDWSIESAMASPGIKSYNSNFGDLDSQESLDFPGVNIQIKLKRDAWNLFFKSFLTLLVSVILAAISLFYPNNRSEEKMGLIVGSLFTAVGNKYVTDGYLPLSNFNLSDKLHLLTIVLITLVAFYAIVEQRLKIRDNFKLDLICFFLVIFSFTFSAVLFTYQAIAANH
jgi:hypothetical protein